MTSRLWSPALTRWRKPFRMNIPGGSLLHRQRRPLHRQTPSRLMTTHHSSWQRVRPPTIKQQHRPPLNRRLRGGGARLLLPLSQIVEYEEDELIRLSGKGSL